MTESELDDLLRVAMWNTLIRVGVPKAAAISIIESTFERRGVSERWRRRAALHDRIGYRRSLRRRK